MIENLSYIPDNYLRITERIQNACLRSSRQAGDVKLIVVTKHQPIEKIIKICEVGAELLGENYPEETDKKITELAGRVAPTWHMIGHIQSRKIKFLVRHFEFVHSIDRFEIAEKLNKACLDSNVILPILMEVNMAGEESKFGYRVMDARDADAFFLEVERIKALGQLRLHGLMTMPPLTNKPEDNRIIFKNLKVLLEKIKETSGIEDFNFLSMGTSQDFEVAIEEGATHIRIGEAIMGKRKEYS